MVKLLSGLSTIAVATLLLSSSTVWGQSILLPNGQPDPAFNSNAMQVWLRGDSGIVSHVSNVVAEWNDKSNNGNNATQTLSSALRPNLETSFGGREAVEFAGNGSRLHFDTGFDSALDGSFTIFSYLAPGDGDPFRDSLWFGVLSPDESSRVALNNEGTGNVLTALHKADGNSANLFMPYSGGSPWPDGPQSKFTLVTWVVEAGGMQHYYIDGDPTPTASAASGTVANNALFDSGVNSAFLGAMAGANGEDPFPSALNTFPGQIAEFMIYDGALSGADREAVEDYMLSFVPEPGSFVLLVLGWLAMIVVRRR